MNQFSEHGVRAGHLPAEKWRIGCSGFYNYHWKGIFYPEQLKPKEWFSYYTDYFNTIELNTTFYKFPTVNSLGKWFADSPEGFLFSVKAPRLITHYKKLNDCASLVTDFYSACSLGLRDKLGCLLFQFPPSFDFTPERLQLITSLLNPDFKNVVEFRHISWWNPEVTETLNEHRTIMCYPDQPKLIVPFLVTTGTAYIRLHGNPILFYSPYGDAFINELVNKINRSHEIEEVYVYFNNTAGTAGILNALELQSII